MVSLRLLFCDILSDTRTSASATLLEAHSVLFPGTGIRDRGLFLRRLADGVGKGKFSLAASLKHGTKVGETFSQLKDAGKRASYRLS